MKVKLYNLNVATDIIDCNDIDHIDNPCLSDDVVRIHLRDHTTKLCDDLVFLTEEESIELEQKQERELYVLRREDGKYYWKGHVSSMYEWKDGFENAHLFHTKKGAKQRMYTSHDMKCEIIPVLVIIDLTVNEQSK